MKLEDFKNTPTVAVYQKRKGGVYYMTVTEQHVDAVNNGAARKPIIPHKYTIIELGVGGSFIQQWMKQYKIKNYKIV